MNQSEAIAKAREVIRLRTGVDVAPDSIEFKSVGGRRHWIAFFGRNHFITQRTTAGDTGYTLLVNDKTGTVSLFGPD